MSGMTCSRCGRGDLDGYVWDFDNGRLVHALTTTPVEPSEDAPDAEWDAYQSALDAGDCETVFGILAPFVWCNLGYHVMLPRDAVLAQSEVRVNADGTTQLARVRPRTSGFERNVVHIDAMQPHGVEVPPTTVAVIYDANVDGVPFLACRDCAEDEWPEGAKLVAFARRTSTASGSSRASQPRVTKVRRVEPDLSLPDDWATAKTINETWKLDPKKAQRTLAKYVDDEAAECESRPTQGGGIATKWFRKARA